VTGPPALFSPASGSRSWEHGGWVFVAAVEVSRAMAHLRYPRIGRCVDRVPAHGARKVSPMP
jgi:hypothetical protein